jgi:hypothetical protein
VSEKKRGFYNCEIVANCVNKPILAVSFGSFFDLLLAKCKLSWYGQFWELVSDVILRMCIGSSGKHFKLNDGEYDFLNIFLITKILINVIILSKKGNEQHPFQRRSGLGQSYLIIIFFQQKLHLHSC